MKGLWQIVEFPSYWWISLGTFFRYGCLTALQGLWAGPYLINVQGLSILETGNVLLVMSLGYVIGLPLFGRISDRLVRSRNGSSSLLFRPGGPVPLLGLLAERGSSDRNPSAFLLPGNAGRSRSDHVFHIKELVPPEVMGTATTGINLFTMLGPAFIMQAMGLVVAAGPPALHSPEAFRPPWLFCGAGLVLSGLLYLLVPESRFVQGKREYKETVIPY